MYKLACCDCKLDSPSLNQFANPSLLALFDNYTVLQKQTGLRCWSKFQKNLCILSGKNTYNCQTLSNFILVYCSADDDAFHYD